MQVHATITPKFQIHLPRAIREKAGFLTHGPVMLRADKGEIVIGKRSGKSILDLAGSIKPKGKARFIDIDNIRNYIDGLR